MPLPEVIARLDRQCGTCAQAARNSARSRPGARETRRSSPIKEGKFDYEDVAGEHMTGDKKIIAEGTVIGGKWWHPATN